MSSFSQSITWNTKAELPHQIYSGSAVTCQDVVYFIGGQKDIGSGNYIASNMIFEYDLTMDEWIEKPNMPTARYNLAVATVDGKIYAIGGDNLNGLTSPYQIEPAVIFKCQFHFICNLRIKYVSIKF